MGVWWVGPACHGPNEWAGRQFCWPFVERHHQQPQHQYHHSHIAELMDDWGMDIYVCMYVFEDDLESIDVTRMLSAIVTFIYSHTQRRLWLIEPPAEWSICNCQPAAGCSSMDHYQDLWVRRPGFQSLDPLLGIFTTPLLFNLTFIASYAFALLSLSVCLRFTCLLYYMLTNLIGSYRHSTLILEPGRPWGNKIKTKRQSEGAHRNSVGGLGLKENLFKNLLYPIKGLLNKPHLNC